ncbi:MAG: hypothetical protein PF569_10195 [Candidatus Woesearchaeota archaeon]|jgi:hypothetical protein|nr:hypothetical protein [Candidatus Woesearchaeota archaeon]
MKYADGSSTFEELVQKKLSETEKNLFRFDDKRKVLSNLLELKSFREKLNGEIPNGFEKRQVFDESFRYWSLNSSSSLKDFYTNEVRSILIKISNIDFTYDKNFMKVFDLVTLFSIFKKTYFVRLNNLNFFIQDSDDRNLVFYSEIFNNLSSSISSVQEYIKNLNSNFNVELENILHRKILNFGNLIEHDFENLKKRIGKREIGKLDDILGYLEYYMIFRKYLGIYLRLDYHDSKNKNELETSLNNIFAEFHNVVLYHGYNHLSGFKQDLRGVEVPSNRFKLVHKNMMKLLQEYLNFSKKIVKDHNYSLVEGRGIYETINKIFQVDFRREIGKIILNHFKSKLSGISYKNFESKISIEILYKEFLELEKLYDLSELNKIGYRDLSNKFIGILSDVS